MTQPGTGHDMPRGGEMTLSERITELFSDRYDRLDRLRKAKRMTPDDLQFLEETEGLIADCERRNVGSLDEGSNAALGTLRSHLGLANTAMNSADIVEDDARKGKKVKKKKAEDEDFGEPEEIMEKPAAVESLVLQLMKGHEENPSAMGWFQAFLDIEEKLDSVEAAQGKKRKELWSTVNNEYNVFGQAYLDNAASFGGEDQMHAAHPYMAAVGQAMDHVADRLVALEEASSQPERPPISDDSLERIHEAFNQEIQNCRGDIDVLEALPLGTAEELREARDTLRITKINLKNLKDDWKAKVAPILDEMTERTGSLGPYWGSLAGARGRLVARFFGRREVVQDGVVIREAVQGVAPRIEKILWEYEFPYFEIDVAKTIVNIQDARLRRGSDRVEAFAKIKQDLSMLAEDWEDLRTVGPRVPIQERKRHSPVRRYDIAIRELMRDVDAFVGRAPTALPARLDDTAFLWREALVRTESLWNGGIKFRDRIVFLKRYGSGEATEEEFTTMIPAEQRGEFDNTAQSEVLTRLRARGQESREAREKRERLDRAMQYKPKLEMLRLDAKDAMRAAMQGAFWKAEAKQSSREKLLAAEAQIDDADFARYVDDVAAYRAAYKLVDEAYAAAKNVEDAWCLRGEEPVCDVTHPLKIRFAINRYMQAEEAEEQAFRAAKNDPAWTKAPSYRTALMRKTFRRYLREGRVAFKEIQPRTLCGSLIGWVLSRTRLRTIGNYTQWVLENNPQYAPFIQNLPSVFSVPQPQSADEQGDDDVELSESEEAALNLPVRAARDAGEDSGGAFDAEGDEGAAMDLNRDGLALQDGEVGDEADDVEPSFAAPPAPVPPERSALPQERVGDEREVTLEASGSEAVKKLASS